MLNLTEIKADNVTFDDAEHGRNTIEVATPSEGGSPGANLSESLVAADNEESDTEQIHLRRITSRLFTIQSPEVEESDTAESHWRRSTSRRFTMQSPEVEESDTEEVHSRRSTSRRFTIQSPGVEGSESGIDDSLWHESDDEPPMAASSASQFQVESPSNPELAEESSVYCKIVFFLRAIEPYHCEY